MEKGRTVGSAEAFPPRGYSAAPTEPMKVHILSIDRDVH
jgi:hypothetical protein